MANFTTTLPRPFLMTYRDAIEHLVDFSDGLPREADHRRARAAIQQAYREVGTDSDWTYFHRHRRIQLVAPYTTGTVTYKYSSGVSGRQLTLSGGTWPTWARYGHIKITGQDAIFKIAEKISSTVLTLEAGFCPQSDITTAATYTLYRSVYLLPSDVVRLDEIHDEGASWSSSYVEPDRWLGLERHIGSTSKPFAWTILGSGDVIGGLALAFYGRPAKAQTLDFMATCAPRPLVLDGYSRYSSDLSWGLVSNAQPAGVGITIGFTGYSAAATQQAADATAALTALGEADTAMGSAITAVELALVALGIVPVDQASLVIQAAAVAQSQMTVGNAQNAVLALFASSAMTQVRATLRSAVTAAASLLGSVGGFIGQAMAGASTAEANLTQSRTDLFQAKSALADAVVAWQVAEPEIAAVVASAAAYSYPPIDPNRCRGSVIRLSHSTSTPTGPEGMNPFDAQRILKTVSGNSWTVDTVWPQYAFPAQPRFSISDPIDLPEYLIELFLLTAEYKLIRKTDSAKVAVYEILAGQARKKAMVLDAKNPKPTGIMEWNPWSVPGWAFITGSITGTLPV